MARKPPVSYAAVELDPISHPAAVEAEPVVVTATPTRASAKKPKTLKEAADSVILYLDPAAHKALKRYALDQNTKVHSLLIEAVEAWFKSHGLRGPVRANTGR
jgi:hypothetical protein